MRLAAGLRRLRQSLFGRLAGLTISLIIGTAFVLAIFIVLQLSEYDRENLRITGRQLAEVVAQNAEYAIYTEDSEALAAIVRSVSVHPDIAYVAVRDAAQRRLVEHSFVEGLAAPPSPRAPKAERAGPDVVPDTAGRTYLDVWAPVSSQSKLDGLAGVPPPNEQAPTGWVQLGLSHARVDARARRFLISILLVTGLLTLLGVGLTVVYALRLTRPIRKLATAALGISSGDLDQRVEMRGKGEIGDLAEAFDRMLTGLKTQRSAIDAQQQRLRELNRKLEGKAEHSYAQLRSTMGELRATQQELLQSTRLASVGEMAGRTAHEVLNPIASMHGRLTAMSGRDNLSIELETMDEVLTAWKTAYHRQGANGLVHALQKRVPDGGGGERMLLDEDLENLGKVTAFFANREMLQAEDVQFLLGQVDRVTHIIDGMRSLTRSTGIPGRYSVVEIVNEAGEIMRDSLAKRNIRLEIVAPIEVSVYVDRYELLQVLNNLLQNAMQAIEDAHGRAGGRIHILVQRIGEVVQVSVQDNGSGIDEANLPFLFDATFTTRDPSEGTGLGLSISRRLAQGFGGRLDLLKTQPGEGSTFILELPCNDSQARTEDVHGPQ